MKWNFEYVSKDPDKKIRFKYKNSINIFFNRENTTYGKIVFTGKNEKINYLDAYFPRDIVRNYYPMIGRITVEITKINYKRILKTIFKFLGKEDKGFTKKQREII